MPAVGTVVSGAGLKVAVTVTGVLPVIVPGAVPVQPPPLQPLRTEPAVGLAVKVITDPGSKLSVQSTPQLMPGGTLTTVPVPVPALVTVRSRRVGTEPQASFEYPESPAAFEALTR